MCNVSTAVLYLYTQVRDAKILYSPEPRMIFLAKRFRLKLNKYGTCARKKDYTLPNADRSLGIVVKTMFGKVKFERGRHSNTVRGTDAIYQIQL